MTIIQHPLLRLLPILFAGALTLLIAIWSWPAGAQTATLTVTPTSARQNTIVTLQGSGFLAGETVSVWITYPDHTVYGVTVLTIDDNGHFTHPYLPDFLGATFTPTGRYTYTARGWQSGREAYASIEVEIGAAPGTTAGVALTVDQPMQSQGQPFTIRGNGYQPGEQVAIWMRYPNNAVADLGVQIADHQGRIGFTITSDGIPVGRYALTARGLQSRGNGIVEFEVQPGDTVHPRGTANLVAGAGSVTQRSTINLRGSGFLPGEVVSIWATLPDYATKWLRDVTADADGTFTIDVYLSEQEPVGRYAISAYGNRSERRGVAEYTLLPGR